MKLKIISDGTPLGTKLIDEDTGDMIHKVQKLTWEANAFELSTKISIELLDIPIEFTAKTDIDLVELLPPDYSDPIHTKSFEKEIKVISGAPNGKHAVPYTEVFDVETGAQVGAIQEIKFEATTTGIKAKAKRLRFDNKDW